MCRAAAVERRLQKNVAVSSKFAQFVDYARYLVSTENHARLSTVSTRYAKSALKTQTAPDRSPVH